MCGTLVDEVGFFFVCIVTVSLCASVPFGLTVYTLHQSCRKRCRKAGSALEGSTKEMLAPESIL